MAERYDEGFDVLKASDLMKMLGIGRDRAHKLMRTPGFPSTKIGSTYFVTRKNYVEWLENYTGREFRL